MTAFPGTATKANLDNAADDVAAARSDLAELVDKVNAIKDACVALLGAGDTAANARTALDVLSKAETQNQAPLYGVSSGSTSALTVTLSPAPAAYVDGLRVVLRLTASPIDDATLNANALGAKKWYRPGSGSERIVTGDNLSGQTVELTYNTTLDGGAGGFMQTSPILAPATVDVGTVGWFAALAVPTGWLECNGQNVSRTTYADLFAALRSSLGTATMTIASPAVVTRVAHNLVAGQRIVFTTSGALPTGVTAGQSYYVISAGLAADSFRFSATLGGSAVNTSGSQSGTHTLILQPFGEGDGSTTFTLPDLRRRGPVGSGGSPTSTLGASIGMSGGAETHALTASELPAAAGGVTGAGTADFVTPGGDSYATANSSIGGGAAHNNLPPSLVLLACIKT